MPLTQNADGYFPWHDVRRIGVQWAGEEHLNKLRPDVESLLATEPMTTDLFLACLAALSMLDVVSPAEFEKFPPVHHILPVVRDAKQAPALRDLIAFLATLK